MDKLKECATSFQSLIGKEYIIKAGKQKKLIEINLIFKEEHFHHLVGLHKLKDIQKARGNSKLIFRDILNNKITYEDISKSIFFDDIKNRLNCFMNIESIIDSQELIVQHNLNYSMSAIKAKYIIYTLLPDNTYIYFFIDKDINQNYFGRSFFQSCDKSYLHERPYKILYKEKIITPNKRVTLINKLK